MGEIERGSLRFIIEPVCSEAQYAQVQSVRNKVFEKELGIKLPYLAFGPGCKIRHMICLTKAGRETVGAVTVQDTTDERALHGRYGLHFPSGKKVARFTQLTLLKPYRGLNLNLELVLEAKSSITAPGHFHYTWFVTPARNNTVSFWRRLGYTAGPEFVDGDMGPSWAMVKNERPEYVDGHELQCFTGDSWVATAAVGNNVGSHVPAGWIPAAGVASVLLPNEWHAQ